MKNLTLILLALVLTLAFVACTGNMKPADDQTVTDNDVVTENGVAEDSQAPAEDLRATFDKIIDGITPEELMLDTVEVDNEFFPGVFFVDAPAEAYEAYVSMPFISSIAHQVALVRVSEGIDVATLAADIEANLDPRKWICVEAEKTAVLTKDNMILVVMSTPEVVDAATANFQAL